jgi:non-homologous end joining protein Ku
LFSSRSINGSILRLRSIGSGLRREDEDPFRAFRVDVWDGAGDNIVEHVAGVDIEFEPEELEAIAIESKRKIEIDEFVPKKEIDELYLNSPYYLVPDGEVGQQAFAVIREAIRKEGNGGAWESCLHLSGARHHTRSARQGAPWDDAAISV